MKDEDGSIFQFTNPVINFGTSTDNLFTFPQLNSSTISTSFRRKRCNTRKNRITVERNSLTSTSGYSQENLESIISFAGSINTTRKTPNSNIPGILFNARKCVNNFTFNPNRIIPYRIEDRMSIMKYLGSVEADDILRIQESNNWTSNYGMYACISIFFRNIENVYTFIMKSSENYIETLKMCNISNHIFIPWYFQSHWISVVLIDDILYLFDPLVTDLSNQIKEIKKYIHRLPNLQIPKVIKDISCNIQKDTVSCGIFVLIFAYYLSIGETPNDIVTYLKWCNQQSLTNTLLKNSRDSFSKMLHSFAFPYTSGLENAGATCYFNAAFQFLSNIPQISLLLKNRKEHDCSFPCAYCILSELYNDSLLSIKEILPKQFLENISQLLNENFSNIKEQQDSYECLQLLLETPCLAVLRAELTVKVSSTIKCNNCAATSTKIENYSFLEVPLKTIPLEYWNQFDLTPISNKLTSSIEKYFIQEELSGYKCYKCGSNSNTKKLDIESNPNVLLVALMRFVNVEGVLKKNCSIIDIPDTLIFGKESYQLHSYIIHRGKSTKSGHYICYVKVGDSWLQYDDAKVGNYCNDATQRGHAYCVCYIKEYNSVQPDMQYNGDIIMEISSDTETEEDEII